VVLPVGGIFSSIAWSDENHAFEDAFQHCPNCDRKLGYNDGNQQWQMYKQGNSGRAAVGFVMGVAATR
jgi:hypothetical protein